jgi:23S rRNA-/tRNA-specific pseudouridylate synthase
MRHAGIISRAESLQILKNDLHLAAMEKHAGVLVKATAEDRQKLMSQIDRDIQKELQRRMRRVEPDSLIH